MLCRPRSGLKMATLLEIPQVSSIPGPPLPTCILINNVPTEHTLNDICIAIRNKAAIPSVNDVKVTSNVFTGRNYALATVSDVDNVPASIEIQAGLPPSPVTEIFQELTTAEFILNENLLTAECERQILDEGTKLSVSLSFSQAMKLSVTGTCSQVYKFRQYLAALLSHNALSIPPSHFENKTHRNECPFPLEELPPPIEEEKFLTGLSRDVLLLMSRINTFKEMKFYPEEGKVEILPSTEEQQEQCITKFQQYYQDITKNRQIKSGHVQVPVAVTPEHLVALFEEFNDRYNQCHFSYDEETQTIHIISMSSRQFDNAKKLITDRFHEATPTTTSASTKHGTSVSLQLDQGRKITVKRGNIVDESIDIIVNAANSQLQHAADVAGALNKASGYELQKLSDAYTRKHGSVPVGGACITKSGGKLKCKHVIHAVGPIASQHVSDIKCSQLIFQAITNCLIEAEKIKAHSISLPALSTGIYAVKKSIAADAIFQALMKYRYTYSKLKDIRIVILDEPTYKCFAQHLTELKSLPKPHTTGTASTSITTASNTALPVSSTSKYTNTTIANTTTTSNTASYSTAFNNTVWPTGPPPCLTQPAAVIKHTSTNIHYPTLSFDNNPLPNTSGYYTTSSNSSLIQQPTFIYTTPNNNKGQLPGPVFVKGQSLDDSKPVKLQYQLFDPIEMIRMNTSHQDENFKTPPDTPPKTSPFSNETILPGNGASDRTDSTTGTADCPICLNKTVTDPVITPCCKQVYCRLCIDTAMIHLRYCPTCKKALGPVHGNQPQNGTMQCEHSPMSLPGYEKCGSIVITYKIPSGIQGPEHPNPGTRYHGTTRTAYLPNNTEGRHVLSLLKRAFDARLIFTIGTSYTTGNHNTVVWNDIQHKTTIKGQPFGYPDPSYLKRVIEELKAKGIE